MKKKLIAIITVIMSVAIMLAACAGKQSSEDISSLQPELSQIQEICNLATFECYYHNVAGIDKAKDADGELLDFLKKDRKALIEYTGVARIGIDISKVKMSVEGSSIKITIPDAEILSITIDDSSYDEDSYYISEDDWLVHNRITAEMQSQAIAGAQEAMRVEVQSDRSLMLKAQNRAKELIRNYISMIAEKSNLEYNIIWL